jgi:hypothetical protein
MPYPLTPVDEKWRRLAESKLATAQRFNYLGKESEPSAATGKPTGDPLPDPFTFRALKKKLMKALSPGTTVHAGDALLIAAPQAFEAAGLTDGPEIGASVRIGPDSTDRLLWIADVGEVTSGGEGVALYYIHASLVKPTTG